MAESLVEHKDKLRSEGKVELPLNIDKTKYLAGNLSYFDVLVISPALVVSAVAIFIFYKTTGLSTQNVIVSLTPTLLLGTLQLIKHPQRKNISFLKYGIVWRYKFKKRQKSFYYQKGVVKMDEKDSDVRKKIPIKNIYSDCLVTKDNRLVRVIEVSAINLSLMSRDQVLKIFNSFGTFLNELNDIKDVQMEKIAQPINLDNYLAWVDQLRGKNDSKPKRALIKSYKDYIMNVQKSKNMVARKRYIVVDQPINGNMEKALKEIERVSNLVVMKVENMLTGSNSLTATILNNDELIRLFYTAMDYENAQTQGAYILTRAKNRFDVVMGTESARRIFAEAQKRLDEQIN